MLIMLDWSSYSSLKCKIGKVTKLGIQAMSSKRNRVQRRQQQPLLRLPRNLLPMEVADLRWRDRGVERLVEPGIDQQVARIWDRFIL